MESNLYNQWVATQIPEASQQQALSHNGGALHEASTNDWSKDRAQPTAVNGHPVQSPTMTAHSLDLNDFTTLGDLTGSSNSAISPTSYFNPYLAGLANLSSLYPSLSPYNAIPYGAQWSSTPTHIPVSSYSSLNGATTAPTPTTSTSQSQSHQQHSTQPQSVTVPQTHQSPPPAQPAQTPSSHQMMIDPLLTLNNTSSSLQNAFASAATYSSISQPQPSQAQQSPQPQTAQPMSQRSYYNQPLMYSSAYYRPQAQPSPQGTLSPQALHSPSVGMMQTTFYAHPQSQVMNQTQVQSAVPSSSSAMVSSITPIQGETPSVSAANSASTSAVLTGPTPEEKEERKRKFLTNLRPLLQSSAFSGAQAVQHLTDRIADFGWAEVETQTRLDILARIRDGAGNHYYRAWSENPLAVEITREWLKAAAKDNSSGLQETAMPLLHLIDRLPFTLESLAASKLGKVIRSLGKGDRSSAIKDMASNLERRWLEMLTVKDENGKEDSKKRKANESNSMNKAAVPVKKAAVGSASSTKPVVVKKEVKPAIPPVKDAKADSSFFSAPKPKAKLPSFKKALAPPLMKKDESGSSNSSNVSQPINFNPFEEALKSMKSQRRDSPAVATPPSQSTGTESGRQSSMAKSVRKRKSVTWAPEDKLESVKLIERAIYDDDPAEGVHGMHSSRDLDREEGAALHAHLFEETVDWSEPVLVEMPPEPDPSNPRVMPRGSSSQEKATQEERETTALSAVYMTSSQIPDSPAEPGNAITEEEAMKDAKEMELGEDFTGQFFPNGSALDIGMGMAVDPSVDVSTLIGQLHNNVPMDTSPIPDQVSTLAGFQPEQVQQLLAQLSSTMGAGGQSPFTQQTNDAAWGSSSSPQFLDYGTGYGDEGDKQYSGRWEDRSGRGGRGRGAGRAARGRGDDWGAKPYTRKSRPCVFFQQQRCKYGDQCDFLHELVPSSDR